jgi:hypothetical protein
MKGIIHAATGAFAVALTMWIFPGMAVDSFANAIGVAFRLFLPARIRRRP